MNEDDDTDELGLEGQQTAVVGSFRSSGPVQCSVVQKPGRHDHVTMATGWLLALYVLDDDSLGNDGEWRRAHQSLPLVAASEGHTRQGLEGGCSIPTGHWPWALSLGTYIRVRGWLLRLAGRLDWAGQSRAGLGWAGLGLGREAQVLTDVTYLGVTPSDPEMNRGVTD